MVNVIICGTPGTGKSTLIGRLKSLALFKEVDFINLSKLAVDNGCASDYDDELETHVIDEDKLDNVLRPMLEPANKSNVIECIHADMVDPKLVDLVFVCRASNSHLYDRLKARGYNEIKIENNLQSEIFQTILDEASEAFGDKLEPIELRNDSLDDLDRNLHTIESELGNFMNAPK